MKRWIMIVFASLMLLFAGKQTEAQVPGAGLVTGLIKRVIVAMDLKVKQMQNKVIGLQNKQKELENKLSLGKLNEITGWLDEEKELYRSYYDELARVKSILSDYKMVRRTISLQVQLIGEYKRAWALFSQDRHFQPAELHYMGNIYNGILRESVKNLDELVLAITNAQTSMNDGERLRLISHVAGALQTNLDHLRQFNGQNAALSYNRSRNSAERQQVQRLYGLR
ncbi:conjugal transfer protein TraI [Mucilaginibacter terrae]|uniref:Conjugal transfer protein TraI n=1 Tax=Mucilaginibacter terrae TaxID=1955052 RepID=A0ABU3GUK5_9SPHI|nr:conjugal transfer protein TraI [Mucilaginibacter terrae]MDT3402320.1 hypothetical protein [Mucilaginibacter terrae]